MSLPYAENNLKSRKAFYSTKCAMSNSKVIVYYAHFNIGPCMMAAILYFGPKRGLPWDVLGESFVNIFLQPKSFFAGDSTPGDST